MKKNFKKGKWHDYDEIISVLSDIGDRNLTNYEAHVKYGIMEATIRMWRKKYGNWKNGKYQGAYVQQIRKHLNDPSITDYTIVKIVENYNSNEYSDLFFNP